MPTQHQPSNDTMNETLAPSTASERHLGRCPGNLFTPPVELLPCPVCGKPAESVFRYSDPDGFVVWCQDAFCSANRDEPFDTKEEACAAWNDPARRADICSRIDIKAAKSSCPCCGWCEANEKGFKEHLATLPKPSKWERLVRRINWDLILTDGYWICCIVVLFRVFDSFLALNDLTSSGFTYRTILVFAAPLYLVRIVYAIISRRLLMREFDACLSSSKSTTTPPNTKENHHG